MTDSGSDKPTQLSGLSTQILDLESLFARLQNGHTLITGNSRLSRVLTSQYNRWRSGKGDHQWPSPGIVSWSLWLNGLWETVSLRNIAGTDRAVPGAQQLTSLWESTLKKEPLTHKLIRPESLANQLSETRKLITDWQLNFNDPAWFGEDNENHEAFYHWNKAFGKRCELAGWISPEDRTNVLCKAIRASQLSVHESIDLLGFDEFDPGQKDLLSALLEDGSTLCHVAIKSRQNKAVLLQCTDSKSELQQMARRVRYWFEQKPDSSIAIVVPDLRGRRQEVERQLEELLTPGAHHNSHQARPWNISMGVPLARVPMIETAFDLLRLLDKRINIQDIGRVLRSPWLRGADDERNNRALLEKCLRDNYPRQLKLRELHYRAAEIKTHDHRHEALPEDQHKPQPWNSPELTTILNTLMRFDAESRGSRPASAWAESIDRLLRSLGWPLADEPARRLSTEQRIEEQGRNWQALQAWRDGLRELASLETTVGRLTLHAAISQLKQICREKIFQARTTAARIQVLGLYEVNGLRFDHLWVLGLHNDNWPSSARPNPFIPGKLQRAVNLPNSSPQRELSVARTITLRLLETAPDCIFSYPGQLDGEKVLSSPLLDKHEISRVTELPGWQGDSWRSIIASADGPQIQPLQMPGELSHPTARGGSSILKHQALCPFRAFASNRLGAAGLETPADGISPMLHGSLVHGVLECFWKETKSQAALLQLDDTSLGSRVRKHVDHVTRDERGLKQRPAFRVVEADRVYRHVMEFLALEKQRDAFEVIGFEKEILPEIEGQTIRLIIDRLDQLASGEEIIIDYKTGMVEPKKWFDDRPEDPQLPLYAISAQKTPAAVVFGEIRDAGYLFKGVVVRAGLLPGLPPKETRTNQYLVEAGYDMPKTIENWRQVLHRLMADFLAGEAAIDPKHGLNTCDNSYCELQSLCRVAELDQARKMAQKDTRQGNLS